MADTRPQIVRIEAGRVAATVHRPEPGTLLEGDPTQTVELLYTDASGRLSVGIWSSTVGSWRVNYTEDEYCVLLAGAIRIRGDDGVVFEACAGDALVIPAGFTGVWEVLEPVRKHFVVLEPAAS